MNVSFSVFVAACNEVPLEVLVIIVLCHLLPALQQQCTVISCLSSGVSCAGLQRPGCLVQGNLRWRWHNEKAEVCGMEITPRYLQPSSSSSTTSGQLSLLLFYCSAITVIFCCCCLFTPQGITNVEVCVGTCILNQTYSQLPSAWCQCLPDVAALSALFLTTHCVVVLDFSSQRYNIARLCSLFPSFPLLFTCSFRKLLRIA